MTGGWLESAAAQANALVPSLKERSEIQRGLAAAEAAAGLVIADEATAAEVADLVTEMQAAERFVKARQDEVLRPLRRLEAHVRSVVRPLSDRLAAGMVAARKAHTAWVIEQQRQERLRLERERVEAEQRAAEQAEVDPDAPPVQVAPRKVDTIARGGSGILHTRRVLKCELVSQHDCPPEWLALIAANAKEGFRDAVRMGDVAEPSEPQRRVRWRGVDFWIELDSSGRAR